PQSERVAERRKSNLKSSIPAMPPLFKQILNYHPHLSSTSYASPSSSLPLTTSQHHPATTNHGQPAAVHLPNYRRIESSTNNNLELTSPALLSQDWHECS